MYVCIPDSEMDVPVLVLKHGIDGLKALGFSSSINGTS
jgi:hypothetical protein